MLSAANKMKRVHLFFCLTVLCFIMLLVSYAYFNFKSHADAVLKTLVLLSMSKNADLIRNTLTFAKQFHSYSFDQSNYTQSTALNSSTISLSVHPITDIQVAKPTNRAVNQTITTQPSSNVGIKTVEQSLVRDPKNTEFREKMKRFDWQFYLKHNPDLEPHGINNEKKAIEHYSNFGFREQRWSGPHEVPSKVACEHLKIVVPPPVEYQTICNLTFSVLPSIRL